MLFKLVANKLFLIGIIKKWIHEWQLSYFDFFHGNFKDHRKSKGAVQSIDLGTNEDTKYPWIVPSFPETFLNWERPRLSGGVHQKPVTGNFSS